MTHLKRHKVPRKWPIKRKGTTFVVRPNFNPQGGVPVLVILRDMLNICQNRKEVKKAIHDKNILLNQKPVKDDKNTIQLLDVLTIVPSNKSYKLTLTENGKFKVEETKKAEKKVSKIIDKKILKGKKTQLNLSDGNNFITNIKCNVNDSVVINFKDKKIEKCLPLKEKARAIVFAGKHAGKEGEIRKIKSERKMVSLVSGKEDVDVLIKQIMVVENE